MLFCGRAVSVDVGLPKSLRVELLAGRNPGKGTHCDHKPAYLADWKPGQNYEKGTSEALDVLQDNATNIKENGPLPCDSPSRRTDEPTRLNGRLSTGKQTTRA